VAGERTPEAFLPDDRGLFDGRPQPGISAHRRAPPQSTPLPPSTPEWLRGLHGGLRSGDSPSQDTSRTSAFPSSFSSHTGGNVGAESDATPDVGQGGPKAFSAPYQRNGSVSSFLESYALNSSSVREAKLETYSDKEPSRSSSMRFVQSARGLREHERPSVLPSSKLSANFEASNGRGSLHDLLQAESMPFAQEHGAREDKCNSRAGSIFEGGFSRRFDEGTLDGAFEGLASSAWESFSSREPRQSSREQPSTTFSKHQFHPDDSQQHSKQRQQQLYRQQLQKEERASPPEWDESLRNWRNTAPESCQQAAPFTASVTVGSDRTSAARRKSGSGLEEAAATPSVTSASASPSTSKSPRTSSRRPIRTMPRRYSRCAEPAEEEKFEVKKDGAVLGFPDGVSSNAASTPSSPPESSPSEGESGASSTGPNSSVSSSGPRGEAASGAECEAATGKQTTSVQKIEASQPPLVRAKTVQLPLAIVPCAPGGDSTPGAATTSAASTGRRQSASELLRRRKSSVFGALQPELADPLPAKPERRAKVPDHWLPPADMCAGSLERSELGVEATAEVRRWLLGETSGPQCSQVILDRALTVLSNFKLASGCQLEVLGGPLGAIVGGYSDSDWLYDEVFKAQPDDAIRGAFELLGFRSRSDGDWSSISVEEVSLVYRRLCLRGHPSRGGSPRDYLKLQVAMEIIKAFCGEAGPLQAGSGSSEEAWTPAGKMAGPAQQSQFVLSDVALAQELQLSASEAEVQASSLANEELEEMNRALDEYILRQMCFKSEIVDEIARLHEDSAYAILGVSSGATDTEIKKAYRLIAMQCHPDKGGDKEDFQELTNAYEKIMEQRRSASDDRAGSKGRDVDSDVEEPTPPNPKQNSKEKATKEKAEEGNSQDESSEADAETKESGDAKTGEEGEPGEDSSTTTLLEKASKAAEEASRYAKTAAEFAHQAAEAAEAARKDQERGSRDSMTKSVAHSAIVYTLTVVKAVRAVGYATLDVAAQCRAANKRNPSANSCGEQAVTAMSLGLEALNSALSCAEVTEITAAELQAPLQEEEDQSSAAERFVGAAVRASLAAAGASNAAMSAAIAAVEGSRQCAKALEKSSNRRSTAGEEDGSDAEADDEAPQQSEAEEKATPEDADTEPAPKKPPVPTPEQAAAAATQRLVAQRNNNHKVLQRLNAEILGHQRNVREFLRQNRQLIPEVPAESKQKIFRLLRDYATEAWMELSSWQAPDAEKFLQKLRETSMLVPFLQPQSLAIPVSVKARILKMAALYDVPFAMRLLEEELFSLARSSLAAVPSAALEVDALAEKVKSELSSNVAEEEVLAGPPSCTAGSRTPQDFGGATPTGAEDSSNIRNERGRFGNS